MTLLIFVLVLSFLVFVHELGHFFMARRAGVRVEEFGFGYPPKMFRFWKDKKGTEYTVNWLPFGGFVRMYGEESDGVTSAVKTSTDSQNSGETDAFYSKKKRARLGIIIAGAVMNFIFGAVAFGAIYTYSGIPTNLNHVLVEEIVADSPAEAAGLVVGDRVVGMLVGDSEVKVNTVSGFVDEVSKLKGNEVPVLLDDGRQVLVYARMDEEIPEGQGSMGVAITDFEMKHYPLWQMPFRGMWVGIKAAVAFGGFLLGALGKMFGDLFFSGIVPKDVAGPVGIVHMAQKENLLTSGWISLLNFAAIISINLGVVNLLPIPALDGGRAVFVMLEGIVGKKRLAKVEQRANAVGMGLLLLMIVLVTIRDVRVWLGEVIWWQNLFNR